MLRVYGIRLISNPIRLIFDMASVVSGPHYLYHPPAEVTGGAGQGGERNKVMRDYGKRIEGEGGRKKKKRMAQQGSLADLFLKPCDQLSGGIRD